MQESIGGIGSPAVTLELVTGVAGVDQILRGISPAACDGSKVIDGQFRAGILFGDAAVGAAELVSLPQSLASVPPHLSG
jgi:hypothetical protein